jgi:hypothetical protein
MRLRNEMRAGISSDCTPERPFAILSAGCSGRFKDLQIPFSRPLAG